MIETPARRKPGPAKTKDYTTVSLKIAQALLTRVQRYAQQQRRPVSELFREGVEWRIGEGDMLTQRYATGTNATQAYSSNTEIPDAGQGETTSPGLLHEILTVLARQETQLHAITEALEQRPVVPTPPEYLGNTTQVPPRRRRVPPPVREEHTRQRVQDTLEDKSPPLVQDVVPPFDTTKYRLGKLCPRGHDHEGTGQSLLRLANGGCLACNREDARKGRQMKRQTAAIASGDSPALAGEKASLRRLIRRWHEAEQLGPKALADRLNAQQVPTLSGRGQWQKGTVAKLLKA